MTRTKKLRMGVVSGSPPYFMKDITTGEWTGAAVAMAKSIADVWGAEVISVETTFGNSVLNVQSNKIDIAFALKSYTAAHVGNRVYAPLYRCTVRLPREARVRTQELGRSEQAGCPGGV